MKEAKIIELVSKEKFIMRFSNKLGRIEFNDRRHILILKECFEKLGYDVKFEYKDKADEM